MRNAQTCEQQQQTTTASKRCVTENKRNEKIEAEKHPNMEFIWRPVAAATSVLVFLANNVLFSLFLGRTNDILKKGREKQQATAAAVLRFPDEATKRTEIQYFLY